MMFRCVTAFVMVACFASFVSAQSRTLAFSLNEKLAGVDVEFPASLTVTNLKPNEPLQLVVKINLQDFFSKIDNIVNAVGVEHLLQSGVSIEHKGTLLSIDQGQLHAKIHLHLSWKGRILGIKSSASSDGSVIIHATPTISGNRIGLSAVVEEPKISNDVVRNAAKFFSGQDIAKELAQRFLNQALSDPAAQLPLPPQAVALGVTFATARFELDASKPSAVIEGQLDNVAAKLIFF